MYTCGLTVYARGHIGNFRTFVCLDVLRRTLQAPAAATSVRAGDELHRRRRPDDRRRAEGRAWTCATYTDQYIARVPRGRARARARAGRGDAARDRRGQPARDGRPDRARSTQNGHTYRSDGSIYFKISTLPDYGQLAHLDHEGMKPGARVDSDNYAKEDARDFVLWKATKPGEPTWDFGDPARAGPAGTSSARRWRCGCSASRRSTSTPAAST